MRHRVVSMILVILSLLAVSSGQAAKSATFHGNLPQALLLVSQIYHVSVVGEFVRPAPTNISLQLSRESGAAAMIAAIVKQSPGYVVFQKKGTLSGYIHTNSSNINGYVVPPSAGEMLTGTRINP